jgi:hypothetical protein
MPRGWKMSQLQAEQPSTTYAEFKKEILNEIARRLSVPFNVAAGNSSSYNYASGRLGRQTYFQSIRVEQSQLEVVVLDRILATRLDEAVLIRGFSQPVWARSPIGRTNGSGMGTSLGTRRRRPPCRPRGWPATPRRSLTNTPARVGTGKRPCTSGLRNWP